MFKRLLEKIFGKKQVTSEEEFIQLMCKEAMKSDGVVVGYLDGKGAYRIDRINEEKYEA